MITSYFARWINGILYENVSCTGCKIRNGVNLTCRNTKEQPDAWRYEPEAWKVTYRVQKLEKCAVAMDALGYAEVDEAALADPYVEVVLFRGNDSSKVWD